MCLFYFKYILTLFLVIFFNKRFNLCELFCHQCLYFEFQIHTQELFLWDLFCVHLLFLQ